MSKIGVQVRMPDPNCNPWRSVVVKLPITSQGRALCRSLVSRLCLAHGIPKKQSRVACHPMRKGYFGYVRVYRGDGTKKEKEKFKRIHHHASKLLSKELDRLYKWPEMT